MTVAQPDVVAAKEAAVDVSTNCRTSGGSCASFSTACAAVNHRLSLSCLRPASADGLCLPASLSRIATMHPMTTVQCASHLPAGRMALWREAAARLQGAARTGA